MSLTDQEFEAIALPELAALLEALDKFSRDGDDEELDCELSADILSLTFEDDSQFVLNSHRVARQIWLAAERQAWHFDWQPESKTWIASRSPDELWSTVSELIGKKLGREVSLQRG